MLDKTNFPGDLRDYWATIYFQERLRYIQSKIDISSNAFRSSIAENAYIFADFMMEARNAKNRRT